MITFIGISILVIVTPGPDTALTIRNALVGGRARGILTALGVSTGQLIWATATSLGVVALLLASEPVFFAVKLAGAAYLIGLGVRTLLMGFRSGVSGRLPPDGDDPSRLRPLGAFRQGVINNLGNPKIAVFFASVLPQFAPEGQGMFSSLALLGVIFSALTFVWLACYAMAVSALHGFLRQPPVRRAVDAVAGAFLIGFGVRLATEGR